MASFSPKLCAGISHLSRILGNTVLNFSCNGDLRRWQWCQNESRSSSMPTKGKTLGFVSSELKYDLCESSHPALNLARVIRHMSKNTVSRQKTQVEADAVTMSGNSEKEMPSSWERIREDINEWVDFRLSFKGPVNWGNKSTRKSRELGAWNWYRQVQGFPGGTVVKNPPANAAQSSRDRKECSDKWLY